MSRSLPSFCRYRKKGPAGEALEEMTGKLQKGGGEERAPKQPLQGGTSRPPRRPTAKDDIKPQNQKGKPVRSKNARPPYR